MYDIIPIEPVRCNNGSKGNIFGTTLQLYAITQNWFYDIDTYNKRLFAKSSLECLPTNQYSLRIFFFDL